jgi:hypothetical protein
VTGRRKQIDDYERMMRSEAGIYERDHWQYEEESDEMIGWYNDEARELAK